MSELNQKFIKSLTEANPFEALIREVKISIAEIGEDQTYDQLEFLRKHLDNIQDSQEDAVINVMDCLVGWCAGEYDLRINKPTRDFTEKTNENN